MGFKLYFLCGNYNITNLNSRNTLLLLDASCQLAAPESVGDGTTFAEQPS